MKTIKIFDTTLRDGEQSPGCSMHLSEKLDVAEALESLKVDIIEAGFPVCSKEDFKAVKEISKLIKNATVTGLSRAKEEDIDEAYQALKFAVNPLLHIFIATSPIHLQHKLKMSQDEVLQSIRHHLNYAKKYTTNLQFSFEDASRTPKEFLLKATNMAIKSGAKVVNFPDTVGFCSPNEMFELVSYLKKNCVSAENVLFGVHCHNDLGLATANTISAIEAGADQVDCTINGIGERAGNCALEEIVMTLKTRKDIFDYDTNIDTKKILKASKLVSNIIGVKLQPNKAIVGSNAFVHESGIHQHGILQSTNTYEIMSPEDIGFSQTELVLGKHSGKHAFVEVLKDMGYTLDENEISTFFEKFKEVADRKKFLTRQDLDALLTHVNRRLVKRKYILKDYEITSYKGGAWAEISLDTEGKSLKEKMNGDGPVDAAYKAIMSLTGQNFNLKDYQIHSVTSGKDALGEAIVKLSLNDEIVTGRSVSTDVLEASINAYLNAVNKLTDSENNIKEEN